MLSIEKRALMASFSYAAHVRAETGQKRPLASAIGDDLTAVAKRTAPPFSATAARPDRGTNATIPVARWSYEALQEGDVAFVNATASSGVKPGFFLQSVGMNKLNAMLRQEEYLVGNPQNLMEPTLARHSYVCNSGKYERSKPTKQFSDSTLETNHPVRSFILEGVVCAKTDALNADEMIDVGGAEGVVAVGGLSALNVYDQSAMSKSRVLDHVYVVLMAKLAPRSNKWMLQYGLINSLHVWHGHVEEHFGRVTVLKVWQLGRIVDTNYARDRDDNKLLKLIVAIKPLIARTPNTEKTEGGMVPVDGDKTLESLVLPTSIEERRKFYEERNAQIKQQEQCKDHISSKSFAALRMSPGLTTKQKLEIDKMNSQLDALRKQYNASNSQVSQLEAELNKLKQQASLQCPGDDNSTENILKRISEEDADVDSLIDQLDRSGCIRVLKRLLTKRVDEYLVSNKRLTQASQLPPGELQELQKNVQEKLIDMVSLNVAVDDLEKELPKDDELELADPDLQKLSAEANAYFKARLRRQPYTGEVFFTAVLDQKDTVSKQCYAVLAEATEILGDGDELEEDTLERIQSAFYLTPETMDLLRAEPNVGDEKLFSGLIEQASIQIGNHLDKVRDVRKNGFRKAAQEAKNAQEDQLALERERKNNQVVIEKSESRIKELSDTFISVYLKAESYIESVDTTTLEENARAQIERIKRFRDAYRILWRSYAEPKEGDEVKGIRDSYELRKLNRPLLNRGVAFDVKMKDGSTDYDKVRLMYMIIHRLEELGQTALTTDLINYRSTLQQAMREQSLAILSEDRFNTLLTSGTEWMKVVDPSFGNETDTVAIPTPAPPVPQPPLLPPPLVPGPPIAPPPHPPPPASTPAADGNDAGGQPENPLLAAIRARKDKADQRAAAIERGEIEPVDPFEDKKKAQATAKAQAKKDKKSAQAEAKAQAKKDKQSNKKP